MKDLIIGCLQSYYPHMVSVWVNSIIASGFDGDIVVINFGVPEETVKFLERRGVKVINTEPTNLHIVVDRFINVYQYLSTCEEKYRYVLSTDMKDVVFVNNPFTRIDRILQMTGNGIAVASENIKYQHEGWGNENLRSSYPHMYDRIKDETIYNAGVIAGKAFDFKDFCLHIYHLSLISQNRQPDQAAMNILLHTSPFGQHTFKYSMYGGFVANLGTTLDPKISEAYSDHWVDPPPMITEQGVVCPYDESLYDIVHQYDRVPGLWDFYQKKYGSLS